MRKITRRDAGKLILLGGASAWVNGGRRRVYAQGYPGEWTGQWIWDASEADPFHYFVMARKSFDLVAIPQQATLDISAADRYMLYVNGRYLGRGPARCDALHKSYDIYDAGSHLKQGKNVIAVLGYHYGCANSYTRDERSGLFAQLELKGPAGTSTVATDANWKVRPAEAWARDVRLVNKSVGVTEVCDANRDPADWMSVDFDDSSWSGAYVIPERQSPWSYLEARQTPMMEEVETFAPVLARVGEVESVDPLGTDVPERLAAESHFELEHTKIKNPEGILAKNKQPTVLTCGAATGHAARAPFMILDFGGPVFGFPKVVLDAPANTTVEMTYGPTLVGGRVLGLMQGVRYGDRYITKEGNQTWEVHEYKQFRYLEIVVRNAKTPVTIKSLNLMAYNYPAERIGSFECSDPALTKLWKACIDTTYVHMEDMLICDAVRERRGWTGDGGHGIYGIWAAYGPIALNERYFRVIARGQLPDGMLRMLYPGTEDEVGKPSRNIPDEVSTNPVNIPQFAYFYPMFLEDYYRYFGHLDIVKEIYPTLVRLAEWSKEHANESGLLYSLPNWNFVDWVGTDMQGANLETNALYCKMLQDLGRFADELGMKQEAQTWKSEAERVRNAIRTQHWNAEKGLFVDSVYKGKQSAIVTEVSNGMVLFWDIADPQQQAQMLARLNNPRTEIVRTTPLYFYYLLEGWVKAGALDTALDQMAKRYTPMMESNAVPTIWEDWNLYQHHGTLFGSQVHSGGCGPAWTLSKHALGVHPVTPGLAKCRIEPKPGRITWAKGVFPSAKGNIRVDWKKDDAKLSLNAELPSGMEAELMLPREGAKSLVHNGKSYQIGPQSKSTSVLVVSQKSVGVKVAGGVHTLELTGQ